MVKFNRLKTIKDMRLGSTWYFYSNGTIKRSIGFINIKKHKTYIEHHVLLGFILLDFKLEIPFYTW